MQLRLLSMRGSHGAAICLIKSANVQTAAGFKHPDAPISTEDDNAQTKHELFSQPCYFY